MEKVGKVNDVTGKARVLVYKHMSGAKGWRIKK